jgi:hypothetical protein
LSTELPRTGPQLAFFVHLSRYTGSDTVIALAKVLAVLQAMIPAVRKPQDRAVLRATTLDAKAWTKSRTKAFHDCREALVKHVSLTCWRPDHTVEYSVDTSKEAVGGIVYMFPTAEASLPIESRKCSILAVCSFVNSPAQTLESPKLRELRGVERVAVYADPITSMAPRPIVAWTDHLSNEGALRDPPSLVSREVIFRLAVKLAVKGVEMRYTPGVELSEIEDFLSRPTKFGIKMESPTLDASYFHANFETMPEASAANNPTMLALAGAMTRAKGKKETSTFPTETTTSSTSTRPDSRRSMAASLPTELVKAYAKSPRERQKTLSNLIDIAKTAMRYGPLPKEDKMDWGLWWTRNGAGVLVISIDSEDTSFIQAIVAFHHIGHRGHPGVTSTKNLVKTTWDWPGMNRMI